MSAAGTSDCVFTNIVCGTGSAGDADPTISSVAGSDPSANDLILSADLGYSIACAAGNGHADLHGCDGRYRCERLVSAFPAPRLVPTATGPVGGGIVDIEGDETFPGDPTPGGPCTAGKRTRYPGRATPNG